MKLESISADHIKHIWDPQPQSSFQMIVKRNYAIAIATPKWVIHSKISRQFFYHWEANPRPIAPCTRDFSLALSKLQVIARNSDRFLIGLIS